MRNDNRIALLIDADNTSVQQMAQVFTLLEDAGEVIIRRAYGNWASDHLKHWNAILKHHAIQPYQQFDLIKGKNATDIAMVIDAMDILYTRKVDCFCLVSSDCDFTPLATRLRGENMFVIGIGERKTPEPLIRACSKFLFFDEKTPKTVAATEGGTTKTSANQLKGDSRLMQALHEAIEEHADNATGWAKLSAMGSSLANRSLNPKRYGYAQWNKLIANIDRFEMKKGADNHWLVRKR